MQICNQKVSSFKCETAWEAFKQGTIRRLRNKEKTKKQRTSNIKEAGSLESVFSLLIQKSKGIVVILPTPALVSS